MKKIILALLAFSVISCSTEADCGCTNIQTSVDIAPKDANGNYLINTVNYPQNAIQIKYLINETIENPTNGEQPIFIADNLPTRIRIFLNHNATAEFPVTYVKWNDADTDTIKSHFVRTGNSILLDKIWINNVLITQFEDPGYYVNLVK